MRDAFMRHQHVVDDIGQALEIAENNFQQVIRVADQRIGLLNIVHAPHKVAKAFGVVERMCRQRNLDERQHVQPKRLARKIGVITRNDVFVFQPRAPARTLRGRQTGDIRQLLIGEAPIILQGRREFSGRNCPEKLCAKSINYARNAHEYTPKRSILHTHCMESG